MLQNSKSVLTSVSVSLWKDPEIYLLPSEDTRKCTLAMCANLSVYLGFVHIQLLPGGAASGRNRSVGKMDAIFYRKKWWMTCTSAKRQVGGAVNVLLLPSGFWETQKLRVLTFGLDALFHL